MSEENTLAIIEQREVLFYNDTLTAVRLSDGNVYASIRTMCQTLGIDTQGQTQRITRNDVLNDGLMVCNLHTIQGERPTNVLRIDLIPFWLSGVRTKSVNEEIRPKLKLLQKQAARVLWEAFQNGELSADDTFNELLRQGGEAVEAYRMLQGMLKLAKNQILLQGKVQEHGLRLDAIEARLSDPNRLLTTDQARRVADAVQSVALELGKRSGRNEYGGVYNELYRRFEVPDYRSLPAARFEECMGWLRQWFASLSDAELPF